MNVLSLQEVSSRLEPLHQIFVQAHLDAAGRMKKAVEKVPELIAPLNATERANLLHGQIRDLVSVAVEEVPDAQVPNWNIFSVAVKLDLLVRFKFLGNGKPANVPTGQQRLLTKQQYKRDAMAVFVLAGMEPYPTTVTCGFTLDGLDIGRVMIQRDCVGYDTWNYDIYGGDAVTEPVAFPEMPGTEAQPAAITSRRKIRRPATGDNRG